MQLSQQYQVKFGRHAGRPQVSIMAREIGPALFARMVARVALDRTIPAGKFAFAGDRISFREAGAIIAKATGRSVKPVSLGSEADLRAAMAAADPKKKVMLAYLLYMINGQTALTNLQNGRYPDLKLESFDAFAARSLHVPAAA